MRNHEAIRSSLATLIFNFNNCYSFFKNQSVVNAYRESQLFDVNAQTGADFELLTQNSLLAALQFHAITLSEAVKHFCTQTAREELKKDLDLNSIRFFVSALRNALAHMGKKFPKLIWDQTFEFSCWIPVEQEGNGRYKFKHDSSEKHRVRFRATKGREVRVTPGFIYKLIIFSYHLIYILSFRKKSTCDQYLKKFPGAFKGG